MGVASGVCHEHGGGGVGREATDVIHYTCAGQAPVYGTVGLEDFGRWGRKGVLWLGHRGEGAGGKSAESADNEGAAHLGKAVMEGFGGVVRCDGSGLLQEDGPLVYMLIEHEGGHAGEGVAVDDGPVDGGCTTVARQE